MVVCHLQTGPPKATLYVEAFVGLAAVQNRLIAPCLRSDIVEGLDESQS